MEAAVYRELRLVAVVAFLALGGCASIVRGTSQSVAITSPPVTGATCTLSSSEGNWQVTTPGSVTVERSSQDMQVRCEKDGYQPAVAVLPSNFEGWTVGNLVFGGIIGLGVDAATGAMHQYPKSFQVPMVPLTAAAPAVPAAAAPAPTSSTMKPVAN
jgi:hypothetical protein